MAYYDRVVVIVVESGFVYTAALISELILYTLKQNGTRLIFAMTSQLTVSLRLQSWIILVFWSAGLVFDILPFFSLAGDCADCDHHLHSARQIYRDDDADLYAFAFIFAFRSALNTAAAAIVPGTSAAYCDYPGP